MSGWDVSSTPTWGPQDGPEDTQASPGQEFGNQDFGRGGGPGSPAGGFPEFGGGYPGEGQAGGPPPEFFGQDDDPGQSRYPKRTPGRSFQDLPRREMRGRHSSAPDGGYGQGNGYGQDAGYGQENGYGQDAGYGQENGYGQDAGHGQQGGYGQDGGFGHENGFGQDAGHGQQGGFGQDAGHGQQGGYGQDAGLGHENGCGQDAGYGQENGYGQDAGYGQGWGGGGQGGDTWQPGGQENDGWGRAAGRSAAPWDERRDERPQPDAGYPGPDGQEFGQHEFGQDYTRQAPRPGFTPQDYEGQDFPGQDPQGFGGDMARNDPALQDFFAPQRGGTGGYPGQGPGRPGGDPRDPRERFRAPADGGWDDQGGRPPGPRTGTGPRPLPRGPRREDPEPRRGLGTKGLVAIGTVVGIIIVVAVVLVTHKSGGGTPTASNSTSTSTTPAAKPTATKSTGTGAAAGAGTGATATAYTLSTPATAGGYPKGQDPAFLAGATTTAKQVTTAIASGGGGTVKGAPVSAAYTLPAGQVITFVGYTGTFTPAKVATILASLASDPHSYPAGANGGVLGCGNTTTAPDGAVCFFATATTLGITEFFSATGPETLNAAQAKGAADTLKLRNSVETKK